MVILHFNNSDITKTNQQAEILVAANSPMNVNYYGPSFSTAVCIQTNNPSPAIPSSSICADDDAIDFKNSGYVKAPINTAFNNLFSVPSNNSSSDFAVEISFISPTNATQTSLGALFSKMDAITPGTGLKSELLQMGKYI